jgi:hypothetical protein
VFGLYLDPTGVLTHWRGARDERDHWPSALKRGGTGRRHPSAIRQVELGG